jgi:hypothetical protein
MNFIKKTPFLCGAQRKVSCWFGRLTFMNKAASSCQRTRFAPVSDHLKDMFSGEVKKQRFNSHSSV